MKQFLQNNLFVVIAVGVTVLALSLVVIPVLEVGQMEAVAVDRKKRVDDLKVAIAAAESPRWVAEQKVRIGQIRGLQEQMNAEALEFAFRLPLAVIEAGAGQQVRKVIFPRPGPADRFSFRDAYVKSLSGWLDELKATGPLTEEQLTRLVAERAAQIKPRLDPAGNPIAMTVKEQENMERRVRQGEIDRRARNFKIYADLTRFDQILKPTNLYVPLTDEELWDAEMNWWVQRDLVRAISQANGTPRRIAAGGQGLAPKDIRDCPVKELVGVQVREGYYMGGAIASSSDARGGASTPSAGKTLTGHVTGPNYDVVLFGFQVVMSVGDVPLLVGTLSQQNFNTVLSIRYDLVEAKGKVAILDKTGVRDERTASKAEYYDYGAQPVMLVTFICEAVFMKSPPSWRDGSAEGQKRRREFLLAHPGMVVKLMGKDGQEVALQADPEARLGQVKNLLETDPSLTVVALYEDLIPAAIKKKLPGFGPTAAGASADRNRGRQPSDD